MSEEKSSYFRQITGAEISIENDTYTMIYQKARLRLQSEWEMGLIHDCEPALKKEIKWLDDEIRVSIHKPSNLMDYGQVKQKQEYLRWLFADHLIKKVENHQFLRLNVLISPENIFADESMTPYFLHYGVKESLPPYEKEPERVFEELKAIIAEVADLSESFVYYLKYRETIKVDEHIREILLAKDIKELREIVSTRLQYLERKDHEMVREPEKKWRKRRTILKVSWVLLIPALAIIIYTFLFVQPKQAAYIEGNEAFIRHEYEEVTETLKGISVESLPYVPLYQLAVSYVNTEPLSNEQKESIQDQMNLQSDELFFEYWIYIGRGMNEKAVETARTFGDQSLITYALIKLREDVKGNEDLSGEEKKQKLNSIQAEIDEFLREQQEQSEKENNTPSGNPDGNK